MTGWRHPLGSFLKGGSGASRSSSPGRRWRFRESGRPGSRWWARNSHPSKVFYPNFKYNRTSKNYPRMQQDTGIICPYQMRIKMSQSPIFILESAFLSRLLCCDGVLSVCKGELLLSVIINPIDIQMGNENEKGVQNGELAVSINHPRFQNARLSGEGRERSLTVSHGVDEREHEKWAAALTKAALDPTFLLLPKRRDFSRKGFCGDSGTLRLAFDNNSYLLTEEIYNRHGKKGKFEEPELWFLLLGLVSAHHEVRKKTGERLGDVRPHNVFLNAQGDFKVTCQLSWPRESTNFSKAFDNERTYLAPEDMARLEMGSNEDTSGWASEMFSIGLTVLSAAMLEDFLRLYNLKSYRFDTAEATALLNEWKSNTVYSEIFTALVSNLCQFQPERRIEDEELWQWLNKYDQAIRRKEDFVIEEAPAKVEQEIEEIRQQFPTEEPVVFQPEQPYPQAAYPHPFTDKSVVESYIPPNQHYLPHPSFLPPNYQPPQEILHKLPSPRLPIPAERYFEEQQQIPQRGDTAVSTRLQGSPFRVSEQPEFTPTYASQYGGISQQGEARKSGYESFAPQVVGRPLQEHELPPEVRQALAKEGHMAAQFLPPQLAGRQTGGETQLPPQFVGRTVNETYLSPRTASQQGYLPQRNTVNSQPVGQTGLSFFQNVVDPQGVRGGRIEETVYIQRPEGQQYAYDPQ